MIYLFLYVSNLIIHSYKNLESTLPKFTVHTKCCLSRSIIVYGISASSCMDTFQKYMLQHVSTCIKIQ